MPTIIGTLTIGDDRILGSAADEIVIVPSNNANLADTDIISAGTGVDTLLFQRTTDISINPARLTGVSGIDVFDVTAASSALLAFDDASLLQSDIGTVTILFDSDPLALDLRSVTPGRGGILLLGTGTVTLYDAVRQSVTVADGVNGTILGGANRDSLTGGTGGDRLTGNAGDDALVGRAGADLLTGGDGQDRLDGGADNDTLLGGAGFDLLTGGGGVNLVTGGEGADTYVMTVGETLTITDFDIANPYERIDLRAFAGLDFAALTLAASGAGTIITPARGSPLTLSGVAVPNLQARMFVLDGDDVVTLAEGLGRAPDFEFTAGIDRFTGTAGSDVFEALGLLTKLSETDVFNGGEGTDILRIWGTDRSLAPARLVGMSSIEVIDLTGATGSSALTIDAAMVARSGSGILTVRHGAASLFLDTELAGAASTVVVEGTGQVSLRDSFEQSVTVSDAIAGNLVGGNKNDEILGGKRGDSLAGGEGNDTIFGNDGNDTLLGQDGADTQSGGGGINILTGGAGTDRFIVTVGETLTITDYSVADTLERIDLRAFAGLRFGGLTVTASEANTVITLPQGASITLLGVSTATVNAGMFIFDNEVPAAFFALTEDVDRFTGGAGDDVIELVGNIIKLTDTDRIDGGAGIDTLRVIGADRLLSESRLSALTSVEVIDLTMATGSHSVTVDAGLVARSGMGDITLRFGASQIFLDSAGAPLPASVIVEGSGLVTLRDIPGQVVTVSNLAAGNISGSNKDDRIDGGAMNDTLAGNAGHDMINGKGGNDMLLGSDGRDTIVGGTGNDSLYGGADHDLLVVDGGVDQLTGGGGNDVFQIRAETNGTVITDLDSANLLERIDLTGLIGLRNIGDLTIADTVAGARITATGLNVTLMGVGADELDRGNFLFAGQNPLVFNVDASTPTARLQQLLNDAPPGAVINMAAGVYSITESLLINRSDISLIGAGEGRTILRTEIPAAEAASTIEVRPDQMARQIGVLVGDAVKDSTTVTLQAGHGMKADDILYLAQANDAAWLAETGNTGWLEPESTPDTANRYFLREQHSRILSVNGNTVTLADALAYTFAGNVATAAQSTFLSGVTLSGFTIQGTFGTPDPFYFENTLAGWDSIAALEFDGVTDSTVSHISILDPAAHAFSFQRNYNVTGDSLTAIGAHNKSGSSGYHFYLQESFANIFTNLYSSGARHAVLTSSYSAEHYNNLHLLFTDRDINFHGSPDAGNTIVVDRSAQNYPLGSDPQWSAVHPGIFPLHPYSTITANDVTFKIAQTGERADRVVAHTSGGNISTGIGGDTIIGGAGNDTIDGGENNDTLQGGAGPDRFIRQFADGFDLITDFQTGAAGDVLVIRGSAYTAFGQIRMTQVGNDTILEFGPTGSIRMLNTRASSFVPGNFVLETDTQLGQTISAAATQFFVVGTDKGDTVILSRAHIDTPTEVRAGTGYDTVKFNASSLFGNLGSVGTYWSVEQFDVSSVATVSITVDNPLVSRSDSGKLTIAAGDTGTMMLNVVGLGTGKSVWVDGARDVRLSGGINHVVYATDRIGVNITGDTQADVINGGRAGDVLKGAAGNDTVLGGAGTDTLDGGSGADLMNGGPGSDTFIVDHIGDRISENRTWTGTDTVLASVDFRMGTAHIENLTLTGTGNIRGIGNGLNNIITGNASNNLLDGGKNNDTLIGGQGDDIYYIRAPGDIAVERAGEGLDAVWAFRTSALFDNVENLLLQTSGAINGTGNTLDNMIVGNNANNVLAGRDGNDTLRGQGGADTFVFDTDLNAATNVDSILDFTLGLDDIRLVNRVFTGLSRGGLSADAFVPGTTARDANDHILYDRFSGQLWFDADGNGAGGKVLFANLSNKALLTADDFSIF